VRGTYLNTATVAVGATLGLAVGKYLSPDYQSAAMNGLGLVVVGIGIKMFLDSKNILIIAASIALGGIIGRMMGIQIGIEDFANWAEVSLGAGGTFSEGLITTSILFCVGPLSLLGCIKDGLEGDTELLKLKSTMDGFGAFFFASALGVGVLATALVVLVFQGILTRLAWKLEFLVEDQEFIAEVTAAGGVMMLAIGIGLVGIKDLPTANYLPALALAPLFVVISRRIAGREPEELRGGQSPL
jgi:uncharacterized membrane protein YqgA involved in biofilm formation